jgi:hypothetical protein
MSRRPYAFRQRDVTRAFRAVVAAGFRIAGVKIDAQNGAIEIVTADDGAQDSTLLAQESNEWDRI